MHALTGLIFEPSCEQIVEYNPTTGLHLINYDDGDQKSHSLDEEEDEAALIWLSAPAHSGAQSKKVLSSSKRRRPSCPVSALPSAARSTTSKKRSAGFDSPAFDVPAHGKSTCGGSVSTFSASLTLPDPPPPGNEVTSTQPQYGDADVDTEGAHAEVGDALMAVDSRGYAAEAKVMRVHESDNGTRRLHIHWVGFKRRHDEWITVGTRRLKFHAPRPPPPILHPVHAPSPTGKREDRAALSEAESEDSESLYALCTFT